MVRYRDRDWLELMYHGREHTQAETAACCDVSARTVRTYVDEHGIPTREVRGRNHGLYGRRRSEETRTKIADTLEDREYEDHWREWLVEAKRGSEVSEETRAKIAESLTGIERSSTTRERMSESTRREANPMWKGGVSDHYIDYGSEWPAARRRVRDRDEVCRECGEDGTNRYLDVHHILPVRDFRNAESASLAGAHDTRTLVLLCRSCHARAELGDLEFASGIEPPE
jgi:5-methylcytosine-specific restriction endonuclease McrA